MEKTGVYIYDNTINKEHMEDLASISKMSGWEYGHIGNHEHHEYIPLDQDGNEYDKIILQKQEYGLGYQDQHWRFEFGTQWKNNSPNGSNHNGMFIPNHRIGLSELWSEVIHKTIKQKFNIDLNLVRAYANGVTSDRHGFIHKDSDWDYAWTILYYANLIWKPNWRGETVFYTEGGKDTTDIVYPKPGRWVIFNSTQWHVGSPVTSFFRGLRITYAFKAFDRKILKELVAKDLSPSKLHLADPDYDLADELKGVW